MFKEEYENMCPVITKYITAKEKCPWFNGDIVRARKRRRAAEKKWKRRKTVKIGRVTKVKGIM